MKALFPPWADTVVRTGGLVLLGVLAGVPTLLMIWVRTPVVRGEYKPLQQPVEFDHRHHVRDDGIDCRYCHFEVERSRYAGVPPLSVCMNCHSQLWNASEMLEPIRKRYFSGTPIYWRRIHRLPSFAYFHHAVHVNRGIGCASCHGRVDLMPSVYAVSDLTMGWCLDCHRSPEKHLRPLTAITRMDWVPSVPQEELGKKLRAELGVNPPTNCSACHR